MFINPDLANEVAEGKYVRTEAIAVKRLVKGLPDNEPKEDIKAEVRLFALIATGHYNPNRGMSFNSFLTMFLNSRCTNHLQYFYAANRNPGYCKVLEFDVTGPKVSADFPIELESLKDSLSPYSRNLLDSAIKSNTHVLRNALARGRAISSLQRMVGGSRKRVTAALQEIQEKSLEHVSCL